MLELNLIRKGILLQIGPREKKYRPTDKQTDRNANHWDIFSPSEHKL